MWDGFCSTAEVALLVFRNIFFLLIIVGLILNTTFLIREIRRNDQHDAFINAVTHELKTPLASIRLYLETLKTREIDEQQRQGFYDVMLADSDRLLQTVEQVLRAGRAGHRRRNMNVAIVDVSELVGECLDVARTRYNLGPESLTYKELLDGEPARVAGDAEELRGAVSNLLDNAVKYSDNNVRSRFKWQRLMKRVAVRIATRALDSRHPVETVFKRFYRVPGGDGSRERHWLRPVHRALGDRETRGRVFAESEGLGG